MGARRAVLRGSDKEVVVKVLKPGVEDVLTTDLSFLYLTSRVLEFLNPELERTSLAGIIGDIRASMLDEARGSGAGVAGVNAGGDTALALHWRCFQCVGCLRSGGMPRVGATESYKALGSREGCCLVLSKWLTYPGSVSQWAGECGGLVVREFPLR